MIDDTNSRLHQSPEYREEQFSAALDGMLSPAEQAALDAHLASCATCSAELAALRQVRMLLRAMPEPSLPRSFLLPVEDEAPAAKVTPLRQPATARRGNGGNHGSRRATRTLVVTRWVGVLAAVLGMALFLGTVLPGVMHSNTNMSSASAPNSAAQPATDQTSTASATSHVLQSATLPPTQTNGDSGPSLNQGKTATTSTATETAAETTTAAEAHGYEPFSGPTPFDLLRLLALILVVAGVGVAVVTVIVARRG